MATPDIAPFNKYIGNGATTQFSVGFPYIDTDFIHVYIKRANSDQEEVETTDWEWVNETTIRFPATGSSEAILADGEVLVVQRETPTESEFTFANQKRLFPEDVMKADDLEMHILQEQARELDRSVKVNETSSVDPDELVNEVERMYQSIDNIDAVAANKTNIDAVAGNELNINAVNANKENIDTAAANIQAIKDAPNQANLAKQYADQAKFVTEIELNEIRTNCITEIPQDIKLELNNGTLKLKAGSKVYVPNGADVFDVVNVASDITLAKSYSRLYFVFIKSNGAQSEAIPVSYCFSGESQPTFSNNYEIWYDKSNNKIKLKTSVGWEDGYSLPICVVVNDTTPAYGVSSIDKVFNGFGYIGSTVFALPGVKGLIPNGRNEDGSLKNIEFEVPTVKVSKNTGSGRDIFTIDKTNTFNRVPSSAYRFDFKNNKWVLANGEADRFHCVCGTTTGDITSFHPKTTFRAIDYNDKRMLSSVVNVKDFGAKGDGITDDTNAIQAAINSTHNANTGIRDIVFFPSGVYKVSTIKISNGQTVILSNPTLVSESTALEIDNACAGTIVEYANITAKDCGIWIKRGKAVHLEHVRVDITHETANSNNVYGIHIGGGADGLYAGNENIISDCSIYSKNFINSYGFYNQADDNHVNNLIIYNFKYGIRDGGGANTYDQIHGWLEGVRDGTEQDLIDSLTNSALLYTYRDVTMQNAYADNYQYAIFCTDSDGLYQHKFDGLLVFHSSTWPDSLNIYGIRANNNYKNSIFVSNFDMNNTSKANQFFGNFGQRYIPGFYTQNSYNSNAVMPFVGSSLETDVGVGSGNDARLNAVKANRQTVTGYLGFGSWSSGAYWLRLNLNSNESFPEGNISMQQTAKGTYFVTPHIIPQNDNNEKLGEAEKRWKEIFCANATINTSDERQKQEITDIDESVFRAWDKIEFKQFLFNEAVEKKGKENARIHFGLIAQKVKEIFESEGLDPFKYGLLCYDEWEDQYEEKTIIDKEAEYDNDGNQISQAITHDEKVLVKKAGNTYGIRYSEALALECAYQRWLYKKLEEKVNSLQKDDNMQENEAEEHIVIKADE